LQPLHCLRLRKLNEFLRSINGPDKEIEKLRKEILEAEEGDGTDVAEATEV